MMVQYRRGHPVPDLRRVLHDQGERVPERLALPVQRGQQLGRARGRGRVNSYADTHARSLVRRRE